MIAGEARGEAANAIEIGADGDMLGSHHFRHVGRVPGDGVEIDELIFTGEKRREEVEADDTATLREPGEL